MTSSNEINIERLFFVLRTRIPLVGGAFLAGVVIAAVITAVTPNMYVATTSLNFDIKSANPVDAQGRTLQADDYLQTQMDIIKSLNVAQKVEHSITDYERQRFLDAVQAERTPFQKAQRTVVNAVKSFFSSDDKGKAGGAADAGPMIDVKSAYSWFTQLVGYNLDVVPRINSRIVDISYASTDPAIAALMANRFANAYISTNLDMTIDPARKTSRWFDEQLKILRKKLQEAQAALTDYQQKEGIISADQRMDTESERLRDLSTQLVAAQQNTRTAVFAQKKLREIQKQGAPLTGFDLVANNPGVQKIKADIRQLQGELVEISASLGKNHPRYKRVSAELAGAHQRLDSEIKMIVDGINNTAELVQAREADLSHAVEAQKRLVLKLKNEHDKINVLQREVDSANQTYNAALTQLNNTNMQSLVDQTNVYVVDPANIPDYKSSPKARKNLALGGFAGLLLGVGLALLMELFTRRVHSREDMLVELKVPLLGHLKKA